MKNKDHPSQNDPDRDLLFHLAEQGAVTETKHAAEAGHAFQGRRFAPLAAERE